MRPPQIEQRQMVGEISRRERLSSVIAARY
jgi:hypothetical protein